MNTDDMRELRGWRCVVFVVCEDTWLFCQTCIVVAILSLMVTGVLMFLGAGEGLAYGIGCFLGVVLLVLLLCANHYYNKHLKGNVFFEDEGVWR